MKFLNNRIALSYQELIETYHISKNTVNSGLNHFRGSGTDHWEHFKDGQIYIYYDKLPINTRKKLPTEAELIAEYKNQHKKGASDAIFKTLQYCQLNKFLPYQQRYREEYGLSAEKALPKGMKAALWDRLLALHHEYSLGGKGGLQKGILEAMFKAYNALYPAAYKSTITLSTAIKNAKSIGITAFCLDGRITSNREKHAQKFDARHVAIVRVLASSGKAYNAPYVLTKLQEGCALLNIPCPAISWVKDQIVIAKQNPEINKDRYGALPAEKQMPYADIAQAQYADDQYQIDGWDLPFYYVGTNSRGNKGFKKLTLIGVWDAYSKKVVGYCISQSENRLSIFSAIDDAVANTGSLPFELVSDNHSANETQELTNFKETAAKLGFTWTVTSNPQYKNIAERGFKGIGEQHCKPIPNYIGQGVKTRDKDGRTKQELIDQYQKAGRTLTEDAIKIIGIEVVETYNNTILAKRGKTPNQLYEESEKPHRIKVDLLERLRLFTKSTSYKVSRGQINIEIAGQDYHYQLPAEYYAKYNNKQVRVRYESTDIIYLFDLKTDTPITALKQKERIAGALANQTAEDTEKYNRHKGRLSGIKANARKENESIVSEAAELSPDIYDVMNVLTTPKSIQKMLESEEVTRQAKKRGIDVDRVDTIRITPELDNPVFKERARTRNERSPYAPVNHKITEILPDDY